jgi:hypothetical protein
MILSPLSGEWGLGGIDSGSCPGSGRVHSLFIVFSVKPQASNLERFLNV